MYTSRIPARWLLLMFFSDKTVGRLPYVLFRVPVQPTPGELKDDKITLALCHAVNTGIIRPEFARSNGPAARLDWLPKFGGHHYRPQYTPGRPNWPSPGTAVLRYRDSAYSTDPCRRHAR